MDFSLNSGYGLESLWKHYWPTLSSIPKFTAVNFRVSVVIQYKIIYTFQLGVFPNRLFLSYLFLFLKSRDLQAIITKYFSAPTILIIFFFYS